MADDSTNKALSDLAAFKAVSEPAIQRHEKSIQDLVAGARTAEIAASTLSLRVATMEAILAGYRKLGFWALCLVLGAIATPVIKFALSGGIYAIPLTK